MVICLERGADLHMFQLMPLPLTVSCFSKIQIGFAFLVPAHLGSPGKRAVKRVCVLDGGRRGHEKKLFKRFRLDTRKFVFSNRMVDNWNSLSAQCVNSCTITTFKKHVSV